MLSSIDLMVAYLDPDFNFIHVNRAYAAADEREPEFYVGKNHFALFPNAENETIFRRVVETGEAYYVYAKPFEYAEHPERGVTHWDWSLQPIKDARGKVSALVLSLINVTERIQAEEKVRELAREMILLQEEDRQRVSRILHEDTSQVIAAVKMQLESLEIDIPTELMLFRQRVRDTATQLGEVIEGVRALAGDLRPLILDTVGLDASLKDLCESLAQRTGLCIEYRSSDLRDVGNVQAILLYRFVQEALANAVRHAQAHEIRVVVNRDTTEITATVEDDGVGFDSQGAVPTLRGRRGSGLTAMRERLGLLGGQLEIHSQTGQATQLVAHVPWQW